MTWPATAEELRAAGYRRPAHGDRSACRSCGAEMLWARTPAGRWIPLEAIVDPDSGERRWREHFASCVDAAIHRRRAAERRHRQ